MGADLYIHKIYDQVQARYKPLFDEAVKARNVLPEGSPDRVAAQQKVHEAYDLIYSEGYFRDSYNSSNLLWLFDLSYWRDFEGLIDEDQNMSPENARKLLQMLEEREPLFEEHLQTVELDPGETREESTAYFREKYAELRGFLRTAIDCNLPIECSV